MWRALKYKFDVAAVINPFYIYTISFLIGMLVYQLGWSNIYPELSAGLIIFLVSSFILFIYTGYSMRKNGFLSFSFRSFNLIFNDIIFWLIMILGLINVLYTGYLPVIERTHDYREFGMPVVDPLFNTMSIFFSVFFLQTSLEHKKRRFLLYYFIIVVIQVLIFRRATIVWIFVSSSFLLLLYYRKIYLIALLVLIIVVPLLSYSFGLLGNIRSNFTRSQVLNDLGASSAFRKSGVCHNHYMTYLYLTSPLANLQENINHGKGLLNNNQLKAFCFYCLVPESITMRLEKELNLSKPDCYLINKNLIVGTIFMMSFYTMGWPGMAAMLLFLLAFISLCLVIIRRWNTFNITTFSLLTTTASLLIFSNFLNRLDIILLLFVYPIVFHLIIKKTDEKMVSRNIKV